MKRKKIENTEDREMDRHRHIRTQGGADKTDGSTHKWTDREKSDWQVDRLKTHPDRRKVREDRYVNSQAQRERRKTKAAKPRQTEAYRRQRGKRIDMKTDQNKIKTYRQT